MNSTMKNIYRLPFFVLWLAVVGCGDGRVAVTGTVQFGDGTPLDRGIVFFENKALMASGKIQKDGTYLLIAGEEKGILPGDYQVSIGGLTGPTIIPSSEPGSMPTVIPPQPSPIDKKFFSPSTSGLTCKVKKSTIYDITVEPPH